MGLGDVDYVGYWIPATGFYYLPDVGVAFDRDVAAGAGGDFLDIGESLFALEDQDGVVGVLRGDADYGEGFVDEGVGAVLHLAGRVAFGVDVGDLLEVERAFEAPGSPLPSEL